MWIYFIAVLLKKHNISRLFLVKYTSFFLKRVVVKSVFFGKYLLGYLRMFGLDSKRPGCYI